MRFSFHPDAETEFLEAINYYEEKETGLGYEFAAEVYAAIERIMAMPKAWPHFTQDIRRILLRRFPYGLLYATGDNEIFIVAVMHLRREPRYWKKRAK